MSSSSTFFVPGSERQLKVYDAINDLYEKLLSRYSGYDVTDTMLRATMESVCPLAPREAKDYALRRLRQDFGGHMDRDTFKHVLCNVLATDRSAQPHEVLDRIESESRRLQKAIDYDERTRALTQRDPTEDPYFLPSRAVERLMTQEKTVLNMEKSLQEMELKYQELSNSNNHRNTTQQQVSASQAIVDARRRAQEDVKKEMNYEKKPEFATSPVHQEGSTSPSTSSGVGLRPVPQQHEATSPELVQLNVGGEVVKVEHPTPHQEAAGQAVMMAEARALLAERRLVEANAKLEKYGHFYDRRAQAVHNSRIIADAAFEAKTAQQQHQRQADAHREAIIASYSTITSPYIRQQQGLTPPPHSPSRHTPTTTYPSPGRAATSVASGGGPSPMKYDSVLGPASFALQSNARRDTDTVLSTQIPIAYEDAARVLLPSSQRGYPTTSSSPSRNPYQNGIGYQSRMDGMYHLLNLEKGETDRWRGQAGW